jgi:hypothetical protein
MKDTPGHSDNIPEDARTWPGLAQVANAVRPGAVWVVLRTHSGLVLQDSLWA